MNDDFFAPHMDLITFKSGEIRCPACGMECTHPVEVRVNKGGRITSISAEENRDRIGPSSGRGVLIEVFFTCEAGDGFVWQLQFHKGTTYWRLKPSPDHNHDPALETGLNTMWRD